jgi:hypothetical protein
MFSSARSTTSGSNFREISSPEDLGSRWTRRRTAHSGGNSALSIIRKAVRPVSGPFGGSRRVARACAGGGLVARIGTPCKGRFGRFSIRARCRSSVVEHLIGNEEVDSSILSGSTRIHCMSGTDARSARSLPPRTSGSINSLVRGISVKAIAQVSLSPHSVSTRAT